MSLLAISLVLASTVMHAGWNVLSKSSRNVSHFFYSMLGTIAVIGFVPAIASESYSPSIPREVWPFLLGSGVCCGIYFLSLAKAYSRSEFTVVYPITRAVPVLIVGLSDVARRHPPSMLGWVGLILVALGCCALPIRSPRQVRWEAYWNTASLAMLTAAFGTVGYSVLDSIASKGVSPGPRAAGIYGYFFFLIAFLVVLLGSPRTRSTNAFGRPALIVVAAAGLSFSAYWLVLWSYQLCEEASYIVACRQFSIVIGAIMAVALLKERVGATRMAGIVSVTAGLLAIALFA